MGSEDHLGRAEKCLERPRELYPGTLATRPLERWTVRGLQFFAGRTQPFHLRRTPEQ